MERYRIALRPDREALRPDRNYPAYQHADRPQTRSIYGNTGIYNMGNTCYMNSAVQALSHIYPLISYFFTKENEIIQILKMNANKILMTNEKFKLGSATIIPEQLKQKISHADYHPDMLTDIEVNIVLNSTLTYQFISLLKFMWNQNCVVIPTRFIKIFAETRNKFFANHEQHDAEEAYSCILQQMQEELSEKKIVQFTAPSESIVLFIHFKNDIINRIKTAPTTDEKNKLMTQYFDKKREMPVESLYMIAFREMKKYYDSSYSKITELFVGFLHSSITCPDPGVSIF